MAPKLSRNLAAKKKEVKLKEIQKILLSVKRVKRLCVCNEAVSYI